MLRVYQVLTPIVGSDWTLTIPGPYPWTLLAVRAVLSTFAIPGNFADATGNGHVAAIEGFPCFTYGQAGPYGGGGGNAAPASDGTIQPLAQAKIAVTPNSAAFDTNPLTVAAFCFVTAAPLHANMGMFGTTQPPAINGLWEFVATNTPGPGYKISLKQSLAIKFTFATVITTGVWHHIAITWDTVQWTLYVDGVNVETHVGNGPSTALTPFFVLYGDDTGSVAYGGGQAALGFWNSALAAGSIATLAGSGGSNAAYKAAALALSPVALWMMDELDAGGSRTATLQITDGTTLVLAVGGGTIVGAGTVYTWTWTTGVGGIQTPGAQVSQVPLPPITLPVGYTIGTRTLDLLVTDRWTSITIWYDDGTGGPGGPGTVDYLDQIIVGGPTGAGARPGEYTDAILIG